MSDQHLYQLTLTAKEFALLSGTSTLGVHLVTQTFGENTNRMIHATIGIIREDPAVYESVREKLMILAKAIQADQPRKSEEEKS